MKFLRMIVGLLAMLFAALSFASTGTISTANLSTSGAMTPGSFVAVGTQPGLNLASFDVSGTWDGTLHVYQQVGTSAWRQIPDSCIVNRSGTAGAIASGTSETYSVLVAGEGAVYVAASAWVSGSAPVVLVDGPGYAGTLPGQTFDPGVGPAANVAVTNLPASQPVTVIDGGDIGGGATTDAVATDSTSAWSEISLLKGLFASLSTLNSTKATAAAQASALTALNSILTQLGGGLPAALDGSGFLKTHEQGTATVSGTVTANIGTAGTLALAANQTVVQSAAGTPKSTAVTVQGNSSGVPLPISGTITANIGTAGTLSTAANQTAAQTTLSSILSQLQGLVTVGGTTTTASATFTRPANTTAYASGDLVADSTVAGSVTPLSFAVARVAAGSGTIKRLRFFCSNASLTNASFRVHFYIVAPTLVNGDGAAWSTDSADYLGAIDVTADTAFTDGSFGLGSQTAGSEINFSLPSGQVIYALVEARGAYTPTSAETFTLRLEVAQN